MQHISHILAFLLFLGATTLGHANDAADISSTAPISETNPVILGTSLPAILEEVSDPDFKIRNMEDPSFAMYLDAHGDTASAIVEWQRLIFKSTDPDLKARARLGVAKLYLRTEQYGHALNMLQKLGEENPRSPHIPEALYLMSVMSDLTGDFTIGTTFRSRLASLYADNPFLSEAERHTLWQRALKGFDSFPIVYSADGRELKQRLTAHPATDDSRARTATLISLIPGAGHVYLGDLRTGATALLFNLLFIWALLAALRARHFAYATVFGFIVSILYIGTMYSAHSMAHRAAYEQRLQAMQTWDDLIPTLYKPDVLTPNQLHPLSAPLWTYRNIIGTFDGARASGAPVNSYYAQQAFDTYGPALGALMTVDRLIRDWREIEQPFATAYIDGRTRYIDPLYRNTYWLHRSSQEGTRPTLLSMLTSR